MHLRRKAMLTSWLWLATAVAGLGIFFLSDHAPFEFSAAAYMLLGILSAALGYSIWFGKR